MKDKFGNTLELGDAVYCAEVKFSPNTISMGSFSGLLKGQRRDKRFVVETSDGKRKYVKPDSLRKA